jgi:hypothetical protein
MELTNNEELLIRSMRERTNHKDYAKPFFAVVFVSFLVIVAAKAYTAFMAGEPWVLLANEVILYIGLFFSGFLSCYLFYWKRVVKLIDIASRASSESDPVVKGLLD